MHIDRKKLEKLKSLIEREIPNSEYYFDNKFGLSTPYLRISAIKELDDGREVDVFIDLRIMLDVRSMPTCYEIVITEDGTQGKRVAHTITASTFDEIDLSFIPFIDNLLAIHYDSKRMKHYSNRKEEVVNKAFDTLCL